MSPLEVNINVWVLLLVSKLTVVLGMLCTIVGFCVEGDFDGDFDVGNNDGSFVGGYVGLNVGNKLGVYEFGEYVGAAVVGLRVVGLVGDFDTFVGECVLIVGE